MTPTLQDRARLALEDLSQQMEKDLTFGEHQSNLALDMEQHWETIREALRLAADPDWVYVPRKPTGAMIMNGIHAHERNDDLPNIGTGPKSVAIYRAMIAAAPVATTEGK